MARTRTSTVVGLNIEPGRVAAAEVAVNGAITLLRGAHAELDPAIMRDGEVTDPDALAAALRALWDEHKGLDRRVRLGVANARIVVRTLLLPPISDPRQLDSAIRFRAADEIPMPLDSVVLDHHSVGLVQAPDGERQRVILVAARRDMIASILAATQAAGLKPVGIDLSAFAMLRALQRPQAEPQHELYVSVGGLTNLAITDGRLCSFTRVAGTGLQGMAAELAERGALTPEQAEAWMVRVGLEPGSDDGAHDPQTVADVRAVLAEGVRRIAGEIRGSLDYHHAAEAGLAVQRVVLTGPAVAIGGFGPALARELDLAVSERVVDGGDAGGLDRLEAGRLSVAAGLAVEAAPA